MKVIIGTSSPVHMDSSDACEAMRKHFAAHGVHFKLIYFDEFKRVHFEMEDGAETIICATGAIQLS